MLAVISKLSSPVRCSYNEGVSMSEPILENKLLELCVNCCPKSLTEPISGFNKFKIILIVVVLPAPLGPQKP